VSKFIVVTALQVVAVATSAMFDNFNSYHPLRYFIPTASGDGYLCGRWFIWQLHTRK